MAQQAQPFEPEVIRVLRTSPGEPIEIQGGVEIIGAPEVAKILHRTRQRVYQLLADDPSFPKPIAQVQGDDVWARGDVKRWYDAWPQRKGRPPADPMRSAPYEVEVRLAVSRVWWPRLTESKRQAFVDEMKTGLYRGPYAEASVEWMNGHTAIVTIVVEAMDQEGAEASAQRVIVNHAYNRPVELAPEWTIETTVLGAELVDDHRFS